jgi:tetratricopeptide (TPR) repeat protein
MALAAIALLPVLPFDSLARQTACVLLNLVSLPFLLLLPLIVIHEALHWSVGRLVGLRVLAVQIGLGRTLRRFTLAGVPVSLHALPTMGAVWPAARTLHLARTRWALMTLAGPATHLAWILVALWLADRLLIDRPWQLHQGVKPLAALIFANACMLVLGLVPCRVGGLSTDGAILLSLPLMKHRDRLRLVTAQWLVSAQRAHAANDLASAARHVEDGLAAQPGDPMLELFRADLWAERGQLDRAEAALRDLKGRSELDAELAPLVANDLAWLLSIRGRESDQREADLLSSEALAALPNHAPVRGTRGRVLLDLGHPDQAWPLLASALSQLPEGRTRGLVLYSLARAEHALGHPERAGRRLEEAVALAPDSVLRAQAEADLAEAGPTRARPLGASREGEVRARRPARRRLAMAFVPAAALAFSCGPGLLDVVLLGGHPIRPGATSEREIEACETLLGRVESVSAWLRRAGLFERYTRTLAARRSQLRECIGEPDVARRILEEESDRLEAGLPSGPLRREDELEPFGRASRAPGPSPAESRETVAAADAIERTRVESLQRGGTPWNEPPASR